MTDSTEISRLDLQKYALSIPCIHKKNDNPPQEVYLASRQIDFQVRLLNLSILYYIRLYYIYIRCYSSESEDKVGMNIRSGLCNGV